MRYIQKIRSFFNKTKVGLAKVVMKVNLVIAAFIGAIYSFPIFADDDLSGVMENVQKDFGKDSTFIKLLYLAEIIAAVYAYHKTKNIAVLIGILVISIFLTFALTHWVFK
jgi:type IV conjugative transfer system pilin TraA